MGGHFLGLDGYINQLPAFSAIPACGYECQLPAPEDAALSALP